MTKEFKEGHQAYLNGENEDACPYTQGTPKADQWLAGWATAYQEEKAREGNQ